jgi:hypothetical protein
MVDVSAVFTARRYEILPSICLATAMATIVGIQLGP